MPDRTPPDFPIDPRTGKPFPNHVLSHAITQNQEKVRRDIPPALRSRLDRHMPGLPIDQQAKMAVTMMERLYTNADAAADKTAEGYGAGGMKEAHGHIAQYERMVGRMSNEDRVGTARVLQRDDFQTTGSESGTFSLRTRWRDRNGRSSRRSRQS